MDGIRQEHASPDILPILYIRVNVMGNSWLGIMVVMAAALFAAGCSDARADVPPVEQRAQALNRSIMCPVCPGESIDQSQVALAVQMRGIVDEKLAEGWTDEQVREFFVERYGPSVLLQPPTEGVSLAVWILPPVGVAAALAVFVLVVRNMRRKPGDDAGDTALSDDDLQAYYERVEASVSDTNSNGQDGLNGQGRHGRDEQGS